MSMLSEVLEITKGDVVSIVGSGGKTTALSMLGKELSGTYKTLMTSTTKIGRGQIYPDAEILNTTQDYSLQTYIGENFSDKISSDKKPGLHYIMKENLLAKGKLSGFTPEEVDILAEFFDVVLLEADGSREKLLKGWSRYEPVIAGKTTKVLGILNLKLLGQEISEKNIHRPEEFCELTGSTSGDLISFDTIKRIILSPSGLFKNSEKTSRPADKILFINMVDDDADRNSAENFLRFLENDFDYLNAVIYGSLLNGSYTKIL